LAKGEKQRTGLAGEYCAASELLRRGWNVALTFGNTEHTDLLAENAESRRLVSLQVKTKQTSGSWRMSGPAEPSSKGANEWFAFVDLAVDDDISPDIYLLPRDHVAALGKAQQHFAPRNGGKIINVKDIAKYKGAWELLDKPAAQAKARLDDWVLDGCKDRKLRQVLGGPVKSREAIAH